MLRPVVRSDLHRARAQYAPRQERLGERGHPALKEQGKKIKKKKIIIINRAHSISVWRARVGGDCFLRFR